MQTKREKMLKPIHISEIIQDVLKTCRKESQTTLSKLCGIWNEAVGPIIANDARPKAIKGKELIINVSNSPLLQNLVFMKQDMIDRLNQAVGSEVLSEIKFKIGKI